MAGNRFKFQSFTQRIASIQIDVVHRIGEAREVPDEEQDTFFRESLAKWSELNCTQDFVNFHKEVQGHVQDLKQLLFHKDEVFEILCKHLSFVNSTCLDALLDLMAQLTRDLQFEIYPYFERILDTLANLLHSHDADVLENTFVCLAFIFKYLWRYMINDSHKIYGFYKRLLMNTQKPHIRRFAAESIAFLVRKIRSKESILDVLFSSVQEDPSLGEGVGILLFETIKGTNKLFHSCTAEVISLALKMLSRNQSLAGANGQVFQCLEITFKTACNYTSKEASGILWDCLFLEVKSSLSELQKNIVLPFKGNQELHLSSKIINLVKLFMILVGWKSGSLVGGYSGKIQKMLNELLVLKYSVKSGEVILEFFVQLIQTHILGTPITEVQYTIDLIFRNDFDKIQISNVVQKCKSSLVYYQALLPCFLKYMETNLLNEMDYQSEESTLLIKCLCQHIASDESYFNGAFSPACDELSLMHFSATAENDRMDGCKSVSDVILKHITNFCSQLSVSDTKSLKMLDTIWCCVVVAPYLRPVSMENSLDSLQQLVRSCIAIGAETDDNLTDFHIFLISQAIRSFYLIKSTSCDGVLMDFESETLLSVLQRHPSNVHVLQAFEYYSKLRDQGDDVSAVAMLQRVFYIIKYNLSSHLPTIRHLTLLILHHLSTQINVPKRDNLKLLMIEKCLNAEKIAISFEKYMERLLHLRKLAFCSYEDKEVQNFNVELVVRFLVGNLRVNLRPMWSPTIEVIKTYEENGKQFWPIFRELLLNIFSSSESRPDVTKMYDDCSFSQYIASASEVDVLSRPDDNNFRLLMCQAMAKFPQLVESKSRDVLPLFFTFLSKDYGQFDELFAATQDLKTNDNQTSEQSDDMLSFSDPVDSCETEKRSRKKHKPTNKAKMLKAFLALFSKFKNPKALYQESKLYDIYLEMLMHRDNEVQQSVWNCLKAYKFSYLKPYEEHLDKLFQENTFRDALTLFSASENDQVVKVEHRASLMNILIRLLFGKLQRRSGFGVGGKTNQSTRRNIIINFISCCPDEEVSIFIHIITDPFKPLSQGYLQKNEVDLNHVIPLRKQIGFLNMLHTVLKKLSNMIGQHVNHLMTTLLNILTLCQACLEKRDEIANHFVGKLKSVRQLCISRINDFFQFFHDFNFEPFIDMIFSSAIAPQISRLSSESQQYPSPLLKLLHHWSSSKRYCYLLDKDLSKVDMQSVSSTVVNDKDDSSSPSADKVTLSNVDRKTEHSMKKTPLLFIFSILTARDKSDIVVKLVMNIAENILQMEERTENTLSSGDDSLIICTKEMIVPYVGILLDHFCDAFRHKKSLKTSQQKIGLVQAELGVIALISTFAKDPEQCQTIVSLLFPTLKLNSNERDQCNTIVTIKNLVNNCENTKNISAEMVHLFVHIKSRSARGHLCDLFRILSEREATSAKVSDLILDMNAWDPKRVDEPNFERRLKGFSSFTTLLKTKELSNKEIRPLLANCLFYSVESQDMSLRDASISCIFHVIDFVKEISGDNFNDLIQVLILPVLKNTLRSRNEAIRNEFIGILAKIVKDFDKTPMSDMRLLTSSDPEVDFFENIKHIQIHRRIRAVRQLQQIVKEKKFKQNSLFFFLLPLVSHFIFDTTSSKDHNLVTVSIETIGCIMHCLPWQKYCHLLRSYLKLLPKEKIRKKTIIRIIVAILDAFHFDLSVLTEADVQKEKSLKSKESATIDLSQKTSKERNGEEENNEEKGNNEEEGTDEDDIDNEIDVIEDVDEGIAQNDPVVDGINDLEASRLKAIKIHDSVCTAILPQLQKSMVKKSFVEDYHRKSHNKETDEDAVLRVPIALAVVKLLQKLPKTTLHEQLPGILLRVCQALKSRARDVRDTARETLVDIASSLGPEYFSFVLKEMKSVLQRGYQLHVLAYSLKSLFDGLMEQLKPGDFDQCLSSLIQILIQDVFQNVNEEKEADGITGKLHEAKSRKSFDSFEIISRFASPSSFQKIIESIREVLEANQKHEVSNKAQEVLRRIGLGLQSNSSLSSDDLLVYVYHTLKDLKSHLKNKDSKNEEVKNEQKSRLVHEDIYLVKKEPIRGKKVVESSRKANMHVVAEFALQLFHSLLKNQRLLPSKEEHRMMLDPYVNVLIDCINSKYNRVIILAVKSITHLLRFPLPSFQSSTKDLASALFKLLKNYARIGAGTGENYELVLCSFKAMTVVIRDAKKYKVSPDQLKILLAFVEEDIYDYTRQATAFPMLKAILSRKLNVQEISNIMKKIGEISVTSESESVQLQCRQLMLQYLMDYPLGKKIERLLHFYISHLEYEIENGRKSSLEMMALIFKNFPEKRLGEYSDLFYFPLAMRLVNDESPLCRKLTDAVLRLLLQRLESEKRTELYELTLNWLKQNKTAVKKLAIQTIGIFAEVEKAAFEKRIMSLMPEIKEIIKPDLNDEDDEEELDDLKSKDHLLFNALSSLMKILQNCGILRKPTYQEHLTEIWGSVQHHLQHAHTWVRLVSSQLFTQLFAAWEPVELVKSWRKNKSGGFIGGYLIAKLPSKVKVLCQDFCEQLKSDLVTEGLGEQIAKNLIYLMKVINLLNEDELPSQNKAEISCDELNERDIDDEGKLPTLHWLLMKLSYLASYEASKEQKVHVKRICVFRCLAAISLDLGNDRIAPFMTDILRPLHREINSSSSDSELHKLAQEVIELIKELVGKQMFAEMYAKLQRKVSEKKESRKRKEAEEAVVNPEKFARKKQKKNLVKRDQRKRKLAEKKPSLVKHSKRAKQDSVGKGGFI